MRQQMLQRIQKEKKKTGHQLVKDGRNRQLNDKKKSSRVIFHWEAIKWSEERLANLYINYNLISKALNLW